MPYPESVVWEIVGIAAACLTTFAFVPQLVKVWRSKSVKDLSLPTLLQMSSGIFLWFVYGLHLRNPIIIGANLIGLINVLLVIALYIRYRARKKEREVSSR